MDKNIELSPEEIERIKRIYEEESKEDNKEGSGKISYKPFPFDQLERIDLSQLPLLEHTLKVFSHLLKGALIRIGLEVSKVEKGKTQLVKYRQYMEQIDDDMFFIAFRIKPLPSYGVLAFRTQFLFSLISILLGGEAGTPKVEKKVITSTEYKILEKVFSIILKTLEEQFSELYKVQIEIVDHDTDKSLSKFNLTDKKLLVTEFTLNFTEGNSETFYLMIDEETVEPIVHIFMGSAEEEEDYRKVIWKAVRTAEIPIKVVLHAPPKTLEKILDWKIGDTILLEEFANKPVRAYVEDTPLMEGYLGRHQGFYALMFLRWFSD
ncbi:MAG TPA: hypothetical protein EYH48_00480 [Aquifex aeolicus]|nr:hypothetical protein [Aquificales bacterium]HIQ25799.1 hypothetical protein [Aquifex aeolicus]